MKTQQPHKRRNLTSARKQPPVALESLVYEVLDGRPLYYRGYEDVLAEKKHRKKLWVRTRYNGCLLLISWL